MSSHKFDPESACNQVWTVDAIRSDELYTSLDAMTHFNFDIVALADATQLADEAEVAATAAALVAGRGEAERHSGGGVTRR